VTDGLRLEKGVFILIKHKTFQSLINLFFKKIVANFSNVLIVGARDGRGPQQVLVGSSLASTSLDAHSIIILSHEGQNPLV
jgi:hypothetical protein